MLNLTPEQINLMFPVTGIVAYPGGVIVQRSCSLSLSQMRHLHIRGQILMVSKRSLNRLALLVRSCGVKFTSVWTLTYGVNYPLSGKQTKKHLNHFLVQAKRTFGPFEYVWIIEFQQRGACHFHVATTLEPPSSLERSVFANLWQAISTPYSWMYCQVADVGGKLVEGQTLLTDRAVYEVHNHPKSWEAMRKKDGIHRYFAKYANKLKQKKVPEFYGDVGRFWGASRGVKMPEGKYYHGGDNEVRAIAAAYGRDIGSWRVLPKIILLG
jgi:hypothetical protein